MHREQRRCEHCDRAGYAQPQQQAPQQQHDTRVQRQVDQVIAERIEPPEFVFQPKGGVEQRPVVALVVSERTRLKPNLPETAPLVNRPCHGQHDVIPHEPRAGRGKITDGHQQTKCQCLKCVRERGIAPGGNRRRHRRRCRCRCRCCPPPCFLSACHAGFQKCR